MLRIPQVVHSTRRFLALPILAFRMPEDFAGTPRCHLKQNTPVPAKGREHRCNSRGTTLIVTFVACDRSWLFVAWEPPTPSYLFVSGLSSADRSVTGSVKQVLPGFHSPRFAVILAALTIPLHRGLIQLDAMLSHFAWCVIRIIHVNVEIRAVETASVETSLVVALT